MEGPTRQRALLCLAEQKYTCFLCDVAVFPSTALFRCTIPITDRYWARVYGETGAASAFHRAKKWRAFCGACAPEGAVQRNSGPTPEEMRHRGPGKVDPSVTEWFIQKATSFKKNHSKKRMSAYRAYLLEGNLFLPYENFVTEMDRLYSPHFMG